MCVFIAVAVAKYGGDAAKSFRDRNLIAEPIPAEFNAPLPADGSTLLITDGHCACSIFPGMSAQKEFDAEEERRRYRRKGWTRVKIERAIEAKRLAHERPGRASELAEAFVAAVEELAVSRAHLTLLVSDYDCSFHSSGTARLALADFVSSRGAFPQNTLVSIDA
jgi:hypothetical protein